MNENKDLLHYLYRKSVIRLVNNIFVAPNAFLYRRVCLEMMKENGNKFESLNDFLEQVDPVQVIINNSWQPLDKTEELTYTAIPAKVEAPTAVPVRPHASVSARTYTEDMLERWMTKE